MSVYRTIGPTLVLYIRSWRIFNYVHTKKKGYTCNINNKSCFFSIYEWFHSHPSGTCEY